MDEVRTDILIIGGGVAGSAMVASLKNTGFSTILVEPRTAGHDLARGDVLYPSTLAILDEWGVLQAMLAKGMKLS